MHAYIHLCIVCTVISLFLVTLRWPFWISSTLITINRNETYSNTWSSCKSLFLSQQPARFSNRCLQTIGRCWPHLRALGVGGAGCGIQGLASLGEWFSPSLFLVFRSILVFIYWNREEMTGSEWVGGWWLWNVVRKLPQAGLKPRLWALFVLKDADTAAKLWLVPMWNLLLKGNVWP